MSRRSRKNVGLIGLGIIGQRVAENLRKRGFHVFVWNRTPRPVPNFVGSPTEVAELCDFVQIFVADDEALIEMVQQLSPALTAHHIVLAHCTVAPESMRAAAATVQRRGARFLDAPFTGSKTAAEKGELIYYVAGDDGALHEARHFLGASSKEIVEFGEIGEATLIKLATNMVTAASVQSVAEALALVARSGVSPEKLEKGLRSNASQSATLAMKLPKMMGGDFEPHFSVKHMLKDLQIAARMAGSLELEFGVTEAARNAQLEEMKHGRGDEDYCCIARKYFPDGVPLARKEPDVPVTLPAPPAEQESVSVPAATSEVEPAPSTTEVPPTIPENPAVETSTAVKDETVPPRSFFGRLFGRRAD